MSLLLKDRDYVADGSGGVTVVQDGEELLSEVLFRLTARRDSFPFLPGLGSRMDQLRRVKPSELIHPAIRGGGAGGADRCGGRRGLGAPGGRRALGERGAFVAGHAVGRDGPVGGMSV